MYPTWLAGEKPQWTGSVIQHISQGSNPEDEDGLTWEEREKKRTFRKDRQPDRSPEAIERKRERDRLRRKPKAW
jgi:hypothetical protein